MKNKALLNIGTAITVVLLQACAPSSYNVSQPTPSTNHYEAHLKKQTVKITDVRTENKQPFLQGTLSAKLMYKKTSLDEVSFLKENTVKELEARGIDLTINELAGNSVDISQLSMRNHRTNGFTPFITFTLLKGQVNTHSGAKPIAVYIKRGKVPVWGFDEIVEPTLNQPMSLLVKEFSAKLNRILYGQKTSDSDVKLLIEKIKNSSDDSGIYLDVYELGFSNNETALPLLRTLVDDEREYVRLAAISSLGIMQDEDSLSNLKAISKSANMWSDRAMALKSIGDIGSEDAINYLQSELEKLEGEDSKKAKWNKEIISLYL